MSKKKDGDDGNVMSLSDYIASLPDDPVNHPSHYMLFPDLEVVDAIVELLTPEEFVGYCKGNILKYRLRAGKKGGEAKLAEDIKKASIYEGWLASLYD